jgi:hypothetical protein
MVIFHVAKVHQTPISDHVFQVLPGIARLKNLSSNPYLTACHRDKMRPSITLMNAIASSKHGQSSTGCGC